MIKSPYKLSKTFKKFDKFKLNFLKKIYSNLFLCRYVEELIQKQYPNQKMKTPTHLGIGQEAISVGVCSNLNKNDSIFCHHRSHLPYIAVGGNVYKLFCELLGKKDGTSGGKGGSVHLTDKKKGYLGSTAILAQSLGLSVGAGLANKIKKNKNISVSFFGNSSLEEGVAYEVLNFASLKNIPTLFVYENNFYSTEMPNFKGYMQNVDYKKIISSLNIEYYKIDGNDVSEVYMKIKEVLKKIKKDSKPIFIEFITYRWLEHCGPYYDYEQNRNYRSKKEIDYWKKSCPVLNFRRYIKKRFTNIDLAKLEEKISKKVDQDFMKASKSELPMKSEVFKNV